MAAGFIDPSTFKIDSDDEGDEDEDSRLTKKPRRESTSAIESDDGFETFHTPRSVFASSRDSSSPSPSPEPEPEPKPWELKYYPDTYFAVEKFRRILGQTCPDTDDLDTAVKACADAWLPDCLKSIKPEPKKKIVRLRLPPGTIDKNACFDPTKVGFMDFPGELRNQIYFLVFKNKKQIEFGARTGFAHSAAFLRVNRTVHDEARNVLYGENRFVFDQSTSRIGTYYENHWRETNYGFIRKFLTDIGPDNTSLITNLGFNFEDATPSGHPGTSMDARRYENNKDLYWILKYLGRHSRLEKLKLGFSGRRSLHFSKTNAAFLHALGAVKTDHLTFGDPRTEQEEESRWERMGYCRLEDSLKKVLEGVMVRPQSLKLLDPRLQF